MTDKDAITLEEPKVFQKGMLAVHLPHSIRIDGGDYYVQIGKNDEFISLSLVLVGDESEYFESLLSVDEARAVADWLFRYADAISQPE